MPSLNTVRTSSQRGLFRTTVRRLKDSLLKRPIHQNENANYDVQFKNAQALYDDGHA